jgi:hypothetical protein
MQDLTPAFCDSAVPVLLAAVVLVAVLLASIALLPLTLVQRYRVGTSRRLARSWLATVNIVGLAVSTMLLLSGAAVTNVWVPGAFAYTLAGLAAGSVLGLVGLATTRWEAAGASLHYTPNRWLVLAITLAVTLRIAYGFWRSWTSWRSGLTGGPWLVESGAAGALAAGALVLGYYLAYWIGVRRRARQISTPRRTAGYS